MCLAQRILSLSLSLYAVAAASVVSSLCRRPHPPHRNLLRTGV